MPLTRDFKDTVRARLIRSPAFRKAVLQEAVDGLLAGDVDTGKALLRDYVNGTLGFAHLSRLTHIPVKSLMRMFGPKGNPQARNLFDVIRHLQRTEGVRFQVSLKADRGSIPLKSESEPSGWFASMDPSIHRSGRRSPRSPASSAAPARAHRILRAPARPGRGARS